MLSKGEGSWAQVAGLMKFGQWEKIILIGDDFAKQKFNHLKKFEFVNVNTSQRLVDLKQELLTKLKPKIEGTEVALTIASGIGKEHMALISALLSIPAGIRFTALTKEGIVFL